MPYAVMSDPNKLGWYVDGAALAAAHPTADDGDWAIVGDTDSVWIWDSDTGTWKDSGHKPGVDSFNTRTGAVVPQAGDYTAADVGADPAGTAAAAVSAHDVAYAHADIASNSSHRTGDGSDHADVAANTAAILANTINIANHVWVDKNGSDVTGAMGSPQTPFATPVAAWVAIKAASIANGRSFVMHLGQADINNKWNWDFTLDANDRGLHIVTDDIAVGGPDAVIVRGSLINNQTTPTLPQGYLEITGVRWEIPSGKTLSLSGDSDSYTRISNSIIVAYSGSTVTDIAGRIASWFGQIFFSADVTLLSSATIYVGSGTFYASASVTENSGYSITCDNLPSVVGFTPTSGNYQDGSGTGEIRGVITPTQIDSAVRKDYADGLITTHESAYAHADIASNSSHRTGDGSDHADVASNNNHRADTSSNPHSVDYTQTGADPAGSASAAVGSHESSYNHDNFDDAYAHATGDGSDHADVASNNSHRTGDGSDHADVATNTAAIADLNDLIQTAYYSVADEDELKAALDDLQARSGFRGDITITANISANGDYDPSGALDKDLIIRSPENSRYELELGNGFLLYTEEDGHTFKFFNLDLAIAGTASPVLECRGGNTGEPENVLNIIFQNCDITNTASSSTRSLCYLGYTGTLNVKLIQSSYDGSGVTNSLFALTGGNDGHTALQGINIEVINSDVDGPFVHRQSNYPSVFVRVINSAFADTAGNGIWRSDTYPGTPVRPGGSFTVLYDRNSRMNKSLLSGSTEEIVFRTLGTNDTGEEDFDDVFTVTSNSELETALTAIRDTAYINKAKVIVDTGTGSAIDIDEYWDFVGKEILFCGVDDPDWVTPAGSYDQRFDKVPGCQLQLTDSTGAYGISLEGGKLRFGKNLYVYLSTTSDDGIVTKTTSTADCEIVFEDGCYACKYYGGGEFIRHQGSGKMYGVVEKGAMLLDIVAGDSAFFTTNEATNGSVIFLDHFGWCSGTLAKVSHGTNAAYVTCYPGSVVQPNENALYCWSDYSDTGELYVSIFSDNVSLKSDTTLAETPNFYNYVKTVPNPVGELAASSSVDWDIAADGEIMTIELDLAMTYLNIPTNIPIGKRLLLILEQDATGGREITFGNYNGTLGGFGVAWQSGTTSRLTFSSSEDLSAYAVGDRLTIAGATNEIWNCGNLEITAINDSSDYIDFIHPLVTDATYDETGGGSDIYAIRPGYTFERGALGWINFEPNSKTMIEMISIDGETLLCRQLAEFDDADELHYPDIAYKGCLEEDFGGMYATETNGWSKNGWRLYCTGTGSECDPDDTEQDDTHFGIVKLLVDNNEAAGRAYVRYAHYDTAFNDFITLGNSRLAMATEVMVKGFDSARSQIYLGFMDDADPSSIANGIYLRADQESTWHAVVEIGGVTTGAVVDTGIPVTDDEWILAKFVINPLSNSVKFIIGDLVVAKITISSLTANLFPAYIIRNNSTGGSGDGELHVDFICLRYKFLTRRDA